MAEQRVGLGGYFDDVAVPMEKPFVFVELRYLRAVVLNIFLGLSLDADYLLLPRGSPFLVIDVVLEVTEGVREEFYVTFQGGFLLLFEDAEDLLLHLLDVIELRRDICECYADGEHHRIDGH